ncbi:putative beta-fructofuranosidase [Helianthus annuus]|nr:putative beta-fructofuranosidase [Helianthus annuus]KAJ0746040.1 putative beta-fructofuranosidase [Helianthus annuus]KAJ0749043.1 putative beta-fructofuranosidase [Helianthus annuus]KAJ0917437.1 putative beta-fructofuranosidase [Helianthus annuus]
MMRVSSKLFCVIAFVVCLFPMLDNINGGVMAFHKEYINYKVMTTKNVDQVYRTGYHFQPKQNWINDPNAPMYYKGYYHLFYQYNPKGAVWGNIVWAHSVSKDMINWISLKPAITPSKPFDKYGCWSGSATILPGNKPVILYTGIIAKKPKPGYQVQNYAIPANYSDPFLKEWIKPDDNPIVKPTHENVSSFRDPTTAWFNNGRWKMIIGSKHNHRGIAYLYRSRDFVKWTKAKHTFHDKPDTDMWECPDFYPVSTCGTNGLETSTLEGGVKHVFKVSLDATRFEYYTIGTYNTIKDKYYPGTTFVDGWAGLRYDYGNFYASKTFFDPGQNRRILWGWANESSTALEDTTKGWAGIQLIPRMVWLHPSGKQLVQWPIHELESLRGDRLHQTDVTLNKGEMLEVNGITVAQADVEVTFTFSSLDEAETFDPEWSKLPSENLAMEICGIKGTKQGGLGPFGVLTLASKKLEEYTPVFFRVFKTLDDKHKILMCSDATHSSLNKKVYKPPFAGFVDVDIGKKKLSLRILIDHSVVESFGEGGMTVITSRVYPTLAVGRNAHLYLFNNGTESITLEKFNVWSMNSPHVMN